MDLQIFRFLSNFCFKVIFDQRINHHTIIQYFTLLSLSTHQKKKRKCAVNERKPEVFVDSDARLWDSTCQSSKATWGRSQKSLPSSHPFITILYQLHLVWNVMLFLQHKWFILSFFFLPSDGKLDGDEGGAGTWPLLIASNMHVSELVC